MTTLELTDRLNTLIDKGYRFLHPRAADGSLTAVIGVRMHHDVVDLVRLHSEEDATASRIPSSEEDILSPETVLWGSNGPAIDVIDALISLPDPAPSEQAYRPECWVSHGNGKTSWLAASA